jgi:LmbE family N-acetylglucosaminyl deacetylase
MPRVRKRWIILTLVVLMLAVAAYLYSPSIILWGWQLRLNRLTRLLQPALRVQPGEHVLVLAPHPDDETLGCAGSILAALRAGATVDVVWLTSGDGFESDEEVLAHTSKPTHTEMQALGLRRMAEAQAAAVRLGLAPERLHFLGYPDGGLLHLYVDHFNQPYTSHFTGADAVPYEGAYRPLAPYTGQSLAQDLQALFDQLQPDLVLAPAPQDRHKDHRAAAYFIQRCVGQRAHPPRIEYYIVHGGVEWPLPKGYHPSLPLAPAPRGKHLYWASVPLSAEDEAVKLKALHEYKSQLLLMREYLLAFIRRNELLTDEFEVE